jgi:hypothetical protein
MLIHVERSGSIAALKELVEKTVAHESVKAIMLLTCDENGFTSETIDPILQRVTKPIFGGVFPYIIHDRQKLQRGTIVAGLTQHASVNVVPGLSDPEVDYDEVIDEIFTRVSDAKTMLVLVDGFAKRVTDLIDSLFNIFGLEMNFIGGGAGSINPTSLDMAQTPCLITNQGLTNDCALLVSLEIESGIGVRHGWEKLSGPYKVTEAQGNTIVSLDWEPAFETYKKAVEGSSGMTFTDDNFFDIAKCYPFGMNKFESEIIVRDPFTTDGSSITFGVDIPQEAFVDILTGDKGSLVKAAGEALESATNAFKGSTAQQTMLFIDCISRALFLGDDYSEELDAVHTDGIPLIGVLSLGEIANSGKDYLELFNKTAVVGILGD